MKYTHEIKTYHPQDCTSVGWYIQHNKTRARLTKRSRWQGSRNAVVVTYKGDIPDEDTARYLAEKLDRAFGCGVLALRRGDSAWGFTVQSTGYIVK